MGVTKGVACICVVDPPETLAERHKLNQRLWNQKHLRFDRDRHAREDRFDEQAEAKMKVIVLGGGLMGAATAFFLARRGVRVTLIERALVGAGATTASFGNVRRSGRFLQQLPLAHRSRAIWGEIDGMLGRDVEFRATGHLRLIFDEDGMADMRAYNQAARAYDFEMEELGPNEVRARFPGVGPGAIGASFSPRDGSANPRLVPSTFAAAARGLGVEIMENAGDCTARRTGDGFDVTTARGTIGADMLVNAAGAWGRTVAASFGEDVPLVARGPQMGVTEPLPHRVIPVLGMWTRIAGENAYLRQVERGNIVFGGAAERTEVNLPTGHANADPARLTGQIRALMRLLPALRDVSVIRTWSGCEGYVADDLPVMGASVTTPGLFHAFGFCGHGFQLGPGVGDVMAELIATGRSDTPLAPFAVDRFRQAA